MKVVIEGRDIGLSDILWNLFSGQVTICWSIKGITIKQDMPNMNTTTGRAQSTTTDQ